MQKQISMMVGPTAIPERVLSAMNRPAISHRSKEYDQVQKNVTDNLKKLFGTQNDVLVVTTSGTGAMEACLTNCFSPGDKVVVPVSGKFSAQYAEICKLFGLEVIEVPFEWGTTVDVEQVMAVVDADTKGVFLTHNESSTGVFNDAEAFGAALRDTETLLVLDSVSGVGGLELKFDEWGIDVAFTASQKCLMAPPGLSFITLSDKAWKKVDEAQFTTYYFDFKEYRDYNKQDETPATPAVYTLFAVEEALEMIMEEGVENVYKRHQENTQILRQGLKELGFDLFVKDEKFASPTLTSVYLPNQAKRYAAELAKRNVIINTGINKLANDIIRIGVMGYVSKNDVYALLKTLEEIRFDELPYQQAQVG
ncbi:pyridoxal-phosphate-dependent aminotransferase family protein [Enterococcus sp. AZ109]|uniref:pyridoxal-phosphate-dependent aminotransferase family protein n=1 Tax=Enterococcus sp. AZ109 TaxID=2774634 RepID=UPI003F257C13